MRKCIVDIISREMRAFSNSSDQDLTAIYFSDNSFLFIWWFFFLYRAYAGLEPLCYSNALY